jgi:hypothetical protein
MSETHPLVLQTMTLGATYEVSDNTMEDRVIIIPNLHQFCEVVAGLWCVQSIQLHREGARIRLELNQIHAQVACHRVEEEAGQWGSSKDQQLCNLPAPTFNIQRAWRGGRALCGSFLVPGEQIPFHAKSLDEGGKKRTGAELEKQPKTEGEPPCSTKRKQPNLR